MKLKVFRFSQINGSTLGILFIDGKFQCYTIEDINREKKLAGETCIPLGKYKIEFRTEGGFHKNYMKKFPEMHKGMLEIKGVPNYNYVLIHIGNSSKDTEGCLLVGNTLNNNNIQSGWLGDSTNAYIEVYKKISNALISGQQVWIEYQDSSIFGE